MHEELAQCEKLLREYYGEFDFEFEYDEDSVTAYADICIAGIEEGEFMMFLNISSYNYLHMVLGFDKNFEEKNIDTLNAVNNFNASQVVFSAHIGENNELNFVHYTSFVDVEDCLDKVQDLLDYLSDDDMCIPLIKPVLALATVEPEDY